MPIERSLGGIAMGSDDSACVTHPEDPTQHLFSEEILQEIEKQDERTRTMFHMLLSLIWDMSRKLEYIYLATRDYSTHADPEFAVRINAHNEYIERLSQEPREEFWRNKASGLHAIFHRLLDDTHDEHRKTLNELSGSVAAETRDQIRAEEERRISQYDHGGHMGESA